MTKTKTNFLLIHGAWHGAWCYYKLKAELEKKGHNVYVLDLPSLGKDRTSAASVTLENHVNAVVNVLDSIDGKTIVVGHSYGGVVLSEVCEARPEKIKKAVYLTAFMLQDGEFLFQIAGADTDSVVTQNAVLNGGVPPIDGIVQVKQEAWVDAFYADCDVEDINLANALIVPQPFATFVTPVSLSTKYDSVDKVYISCTEDRAITPAAQKSMYSKFPKTNVIKLKASHSPFFSETKKLAKILTDLK